MDEIEPATLASLIQSGVTLLVSSGLVLYGFRLMRQSIRQRRDESTQQHEQTMAALAQQHEQTMAALAYQRRQQREQHEEAMRAIDKQHAQAIRTLGKHNEQRRHQHAQAMRALEILIERTAPKPDDPPPDA